MVKICVLRLSSLGDTVLITPVLNGLKLRFPDSCISLLVKKEYAPVFFENPYVDELIEVDVEGGHNGLPGLLRLTKELRENEYDLFLDLHRNLRSRWIGSRIRATKKIAYDKRYWPRRALVHAKWLSMQSRHTVDLYCDALRPLGIEPKERVPEVFLSDGEIMEAHNTLHRNGGMNGRAFIGIHVGARGDAKRWLPERFAAVVRKIQEGDWSPVLFAGENDRHFLEKVCTTLDHKPEVFIQPPLRQLIALIDQCSAFLCHDSGPMHLAVARGVPTVALFGPTHPKLGFWPLGERDIVVTADVDCSPCSLHGTKRCRKKVKECMENISEDRVYKALVRTLRSTSERICV